VEKERTAKAKGEHNMRRNGKKESGKDITNILLTAVVVIPVHEKNTKR
jgi:hypothetical protein